MTTKSFYADSDALAVLNNKHLLEQHKNKKTAIVNAALKEYGRNHAQRVDSAPVEAETVKTYRVKL